MKQAITVMKKTGCTMKKWNVQVGDAVQKGDLLCTVIVGPMNREVNSQYTGQITSILVQERDEVPGGTVICEIEAEDEPAAPALEAKPATGEKKALLMPKTGTDGSAVKKWYKAEGDPVGQGRGGGVCQRRQDEPGRVQRLRRSSGGDRGR